MKRQYDLQRPGLELHLGRPLAPATAGHSRAEQEGQGAVLPSRRWEGLGVGGGVCHEGQSWIAARGGGRRSRPFGRGPLARRNVAAISEGVGVETRGEDTQHGRPDRVVHLFVAQHAQQLVLVQHQLWRLHPGQRTHGSQADGRLPVPYERRDARPAARELGRRDRDRHRAQRARVVERRLLADAVGLAHRLARNGGWGQLLQLAARGGSSAKVSHAQILQRHHERVRREHLQQVCAKGSTACTHSRSCRWRPPRTVDAFHLRSRERHGQPIFICHIPEGPIAMCPALLEDGLVFQFCS
eukprot:scaffold8137_cov84-Isochrysis_galbana.AAC.1